MSDVEIRICYRMAALKVSAAKGLKWFRLNLHDANLLDFFGLVYKGCEVFACKIL